MIDEETYLLLSAYHDGELSAGEALAMERRLAAEPDLREQYAKLGWLSTAIHKQPMAPAPAALRVLMGQQFGGVTAGHPRSRPAWHAIAAATLVGLIGGGVIGSGGVYLGMSPRMDATMDAVVAAHLRALAAPQPFDIASSNRHVVKPWFNGRTTIAPEAPDLAAQGFPLLGGRIDIVDGATVPTIVYHHDRHTISVTVIPKMKNLQSGENNSVGSTIEHWNAGDLTYWVVSDVSKADLRTFAGLYRAQTAPAK